MLAQALQGLGRQLVRRQTEAPAQLFHQVLAQQRQIVQALAQRRHGERDHVQPVVQISAETPGADLGLQVAAGSGNDAHVGMQQPVRAQSFVLAFLQNP